jgi:hypothetical protein
MLAISLRSGIPRNPEHLLVGTSLGFEYMKQGKYIMEMREEASKWPR